MARRAEQWRQGNRGERSESTPCLPRAGGGPGSAAPWHPSRATDGSRHDRQPADRPEWRRGRLGGDPFSNPIALLPLDLLSAHFVASSMSKAVEALIQRLTSEAFAAGPRPRALSGRARPGANVVDPQSAGRPGADADGRPVPFESSPRGWSASIMASSSPPIRPSAGPWSCRRCWPRRRLGRRRGRWRAKAAAAPGRAERHAPSPAHQARSGRGARAILVGHPLGPGDGAAGLRDRVRTRTRALSRTNGGSFARAWLPWRPGSATTPTAGPISSGPRPSPSG